MCVIDQLSKQTSALNHASLNNNTQDYCRRHDQLLKQASEWVIEVQGFVNGAMGRNPRALRELNHAATGKLPKASTGVSSPFQRAPTDKSISWRNNKRVIEFAVLIPLR